MYFHLHDGNNYMTIITDYCMITMSIFIMMKQIIYILTVITCVLFSLPSFGQLSHTAPAPNIGSAQNFVIFTGSGAIDNNNTSVITNVLGDIGTAAGAVTGFLPSNTSGAIHDGDSLTIVAAKDIQKTFYDMRLLSNTTATYSPNFISSIGNGQIFEPGVYFLGASATLNDTLTLDAKSDTDAVFIILIGGAFYTSSTSVVILKNKATPSHIYWWVDGAAVLYANTVFQGSIIVNGAMTINEGTSIKGRGLVTTGAIHLVSTNLKGAAQIDSISVVVAIKASTLTIPVKAYLSGALNSAGTGLSTTLSDSNLIPLAQPYSNPPFNHVSSKLELGLKSMPAGVVDWVLIEVLDANSDTVVASRAVLMGFDGNIMDVDSTPGVQFLRADIPKGRSYNLGIRHRNHLGVRTANAIAFIEAINGLIDFTTGLSGNLYTNTAILTNAPMALVNGVYSLWPGDINSNGVVNYMGRANDSGFLLNSILGGNMNTKLNAYSNGDVNFKGKASSTGSGNDDDYLLNSLLGGNPTMSIHQHY